MKVLKVQLGIVLAPALMAWRGFVLSMLWAWFIAPLGLPEIGVLWAIGLAVVISMFTPAKNSGKVDWVNIFSWEPPILRWR